MNEPLIIAGIDMTPMKDQPSRLRQVGVPSVFDEARQQIDYWEKDDPRAEHILLIRDGMDDTEIAVAGPAMKPSVIAGLCFAAAQMVA